MGTRTPKKFRVNTLKAMAACHAVGLTYHGGTGSVLVAVDEHQGYHFVRVRTTGGVASAAHICHSERSVLASTVSNTYSMSREFTRAELALVSPAWLCDEAREYVIVGDPAEALAQVWIEGRE